MDQRVAAAGREFTEEEVVPLADGALQRAYDDLRQTQDAVLQQERLRAIGQMASGIAHDINNAISPASLYAEALLEHSTTLSKRDREHLETIRQAIDDVAQTVRPGPNKLPLPPPSCRRGGTAVS